MLVLLFRIPVRTKENQSCCCIEQRVAAHCAHCHVAEFVGEHFWPNVVLQGSSMENIQQSNTALLNARPLIPSTNGQDFAKRCGVEFCGRKAERPGAAQSPSKPCPAGLSCRKLETADMLATCKDGALLALQSVSFLRCRKRSVYSFITGVCGSALLFKKLFRTWKDYCSWLLTSGLFRPMPAIDFCGRSCGNWSA